MGRWGANVAGNLLGTGGNEFGEQSKIVFGDISSTSSRIRITTAEWSLVTSFPSPRTPEMWRRGAYMLSLGIRLFNPVAYFTLACPYRGKLRAPNSVALYFRAAQNEAAMIPRDGPCFSLCEENSHGRVVLTSPLEGRSSHLPDGIFATARVSWVPAQMVIRFKNVEAMQKIAFRPLRNTPSFWHRCAYESQSTAEEVRFAHPPIFYIQSDIPPNAAATTSPPDAVDDAPPDDANQWTWAERYNDWNAWVEITTKTAPRNPRTIAQLHPENPTVVALRFRHRCRKPLFRSRVFRSFRRMSLLPISRAR